MSALLGRLGALLARRWKRALAIAILTVAALGVVGGAFSGEPSNDFRLDGTESQQAFDVLDERFEAQAGLDATVVFSADPEESSAARLDEGAAAGAISTAIAEIKALDHVTAVDPPTVSEDGRTAFVTVKYDVDSWGDVEKSWLDDLEQAGNTATSAGLDVDYRGDVVDAGSEQDAPVGELVGIAVAILLLTWLFRSWIAMGVTLIGALLGVAIGQIVLMIVAAPLGLPEFATTIAIMLGLGAGIDYALLLLGRFREELTHEGVTGERGASRASATAGTSVISAGVIVMVAIAGLLTIGILPVGKMGLAAAIGVLAVVVSTLTILPIAMGALAKRLRPKDIKHIAPSERNARWGERVTGKPWPYLLAGVLSLLVLAIPFTDLRLGQPDDGNQPDTKTQRQAYDALSDGFGPGFNGPLLLSVEAGDGVNLNDTSARSELNAVRTAISGTPGVQQVGEAAISPAGDAALIRVTPDTAPQDKATSDLVDDLRDNVIPDATAGSDLNVYVGGSTAVFQDMSDKIASRLLLFIGVVVALSVLLLMIVFRSIWVPLISAVFNLLSIGAAYGVVVAVFQWGWGASLIGITSDGVPIVSFVPLLMFAILFGLSMDYNIFMLSRIREAYYEGKPARESVVYGLARIAKLIMVAGMVMAAVFLAFMIDDDPTTKMFGLGLGSAILIDVLIVRMLVAPAVMQLLGDRAWWLPGWLGRALPNLALEGSDAVKDDPDADRELAPVR